MRSTGVPANRARYRGLSARFAHNPALGVGQRLSVEQRVLAGNPLTLETAVDCLRGPAELRFNSGQ